jgi:hypothetical protein
MGAFCRHAFSPFETYCRSSRAEGLVKTLKLFSIPNRETLTQPIQRQGDFFRKFLERHGKQIIKLDTSSSFGAMPARCVRQTYFHGDDSLAVCRTSGFASRTDAMNKFEGMKGMK